MFSTLRNRFGIPGVISVIALVFAMIGGAYAASNGGSDNGATASAKKSAKGPRGPRGPKGATGAAGPAGPAGPAGAKGDAGAAGANGSNGEKGATGTNGTNGQSVTMKDELPGVGACGDEGGASFKVGSGTPVLACNGVDGTDGTNGSPWVVGTAPSGALLKGTWSIFPHMVTIGSAAVGGQKIPVPISTGVPISQAGLFPYWVPAGPANPDDPAGCTGTADAPTATVPQVLCLYRVPLHTSNLGITADNVVTQSGGGLVVLASSVDPDAGGPDESPFLVKGAGSWALLNP